MAVVSRRRRGYSSRYGQLPHPCFQRSQSSEYATWPVIAHWSCSSQTTGRRRLSSGSAEPRVDGEPERGRIKGVLERKGVEHAPGDPIGGAPGDVPLDLPDLVVG